MVFSISGLFVLWAGVLYLVTSHHLIEAALAAIIMIPVTAFYVTLCVGMMEIDD